MLRNILRTAAVFAIAISILPIAAARQRYANDRFVERIRKELVKIPTYGSYDNLGFEVKGNDVIMYGQVVRPSTKADAESRVKRIEGVEHVVNNIEVPPPSSSDDRIRRQ